MAYLFYREGILEQLNDMPRVTHSQEAEEPRSALKIQLPGLIKVPVAKGPCFQPCGFFFTPIIAHESKRWAPDPRVASLKPREKRNEGKFPSRPFQLKHRGKTPGRYLESQGGRGCCEQRGRLRTEQSGGRGKWGYRGLTGARCAWFYHDSESPYSSSSKELAVLHAVHVLRLQ